MRDTLLIFDIDGTLIETRAGRQAFNLALQKVFGLTEAAGTVPMAGRTDPAIYAEVCAQHGLDPATFGAWKLEFLASLADALVTDPGRVLPGVWDLVQGCSEEPAFALALGTGNVEEGARLKLACHDLNRFFPTGGFGADGINRDEVIARGIARARAHYACEFERIVVIGDTPHDIQCGRNNACLTLGVATGPYREEQLWACGADHVFPEFTDTRGVIQWLRSHR